VSNLVQRREDGQLVMESVAVFSCGCSNVVPEARNKLRIAGVGDIPLITTSSNKNAKAYIRQIGLDRLVPSLNKSTHSVLYNPATGRYVDLLKSPKTDQVFENIYKVARGM
jgi:hypothetical protein